MSHAEVQIRASQGRAGQGRAGQGRAGQGRAGQGRAGQGRAGQGSEGTCRQLMVASLVWSRVALMVPPKPQQAT